MKENKVNALMNCINSMNKNLLSLLVLFVVKKSKQNKNVKIRIIVKKIIFFLHFKISNLKWHIKNPNKIASNLKNDPVL